MHLPLFIEPLGAVDKVTAPWWRLILDARLANQIQDHWGAWYFSLAQLATLLEVFNLMFALQATLVPRLHHGRRRPDGQAVAPRHFRRLG
jgi:hypothetical protein